MINFYNLIRHISLRPDPECSAKASRHTPQDRPYVVVHLEHAEAAQQPDAATIVRFINKFMGDTHAVLFTGLQRSDYLDGIAGAIVHEGFRDAVGRVSFDVLLDLVRDADAVITASTGISRAAITRNTPVLLLSGGNGSQPLIWPAGNACLSIAADTLSPYQICEALTCLLSFSAEKTRRPTYH